MKIAFITAEMAPLAKVGGLADVAGALPAALQGEGCEPMVYLPRYGELPPPANPPIYAGKVELLPGEVDAFQVFETVAPGTSVPVFLIHGNRFFARPGIYTDPDTGDEYGDAPFRYLFFCRAALNFMADTGRIPDVLHAHDSHTAPALVLPRCNSPLEPLFKRTATLLTIHNIAYQGIFPPRILPAFHVPAELFHPFSPFEYYGSINFLKLGILFADAVNTVSVRYAAEIRDTAEYGCGLQDILKERASVLSGILNGIDTEVWNPAADPLIACPYSAAAPAGKRANKLALLEAYGFGGQDPDRPLIGMIGRLVDQKGIDLVAQALPEMAREKARLVLLGTGLPRYHEFFLAAAKKYPDFLGVRIGFDNRLAHLIEAGADMFLMPSRFEPCGLNQMYSLRYGTAPVVRATGGLADTVTPFDAKTGTGAGFLFDDYTPEALMLALQEALRTFSDRTAWETLMKNGMSLDFSWRRSAREYLRIYRQIVDARNPT